MCFVLAITIVSNSFLGHFHLLLSFLSGLGNIRSGMLFLSEYCVKKLLSFFSILQFAFSFSFLIDLPFYEPAVEKEALNN